MSMLKKFASTLHDLVPMSFVCWKEGYSREYFLDDLKAGISVGLIALPLAMAFSIGAGLPPQQGIFTAIVAGFLISLLGGSRVQIGGPTGAFLIIVYDIVQRHGYDDLAMATMVGGLLMILMGLTRFGVFLKFIPYPVTVGFTTGIALTIFSSQIKDFFGLCIDKVPAEFVQKWSAYIHASWSCNPWAFLIGFVTLLSIFTIRYFKPKWPTVIFSIIGATLVTYLFDIRIETIETHFGPIPNTLPSPQFPAFSLDKLQAIFPDAITIALLGAIESLLSAVVADGMTGHRHRSNCELVAQGFANIGSIIFGGIPATGAIARTTANINLGAKTPLAGMIHAVTLLLVIMLLAPLAAKVPLSALAAVLFYVAWNMSELPHFLSILRGQRSEALVLLTTFFLTVLIDLTVAVQIGVLMAAVLFVKRMSDNKTVQICRILLEENTHEHPEINDSDLILRKDVPEDTTVFEINGPFFFGVADVLNEEWQQLKVKPKHFILRMRRVSAIDSSGIKALKDFVTKCQKAGVRLIFSGMSRELSDELKSAGLYDAVGESNIYPHLKAALSSCRAKIN